MTEQMPREICCAGCQRFDHRETKHHPDCPHYPETLSKIHDDVVRDMAKTIKDYEAYNYKLKNDRLKVFQTNQTLHQEREKQNKRIEQLEATLRSISRLENNTHAIRFKQIAKQALEQKGGE